MWVLLRKRGDGVVSPAYSGVFFGGRVALLCGRILRYLYFLLPRSISLSLGGIVGTRSCRSVRVHKKKIVSILTQSFVHSEPRAV
jgi:hypothetical protein